ncbi:Tubulin delta chain [Coelomomyces lativittatus]|nr:Tubulin delta chain [Coelomomyces lativittatus]
MYAFIQKAIHYQLRECGEHFGGFVILHSLAGGTGSGLGSFVTEQLRKEYPQATLLNQVVWPFFNGEVIIQHYNIMLTLYHLIKHSSLILILFNDHLKLICEHRLGKLSTTFTDLNQFIALILYHLLSPCKNSRTHQLSPLSSLVQLIVVSQKMNLATVYLVPQVPTHAIPFSTFTWYMLLRSLYRMVASHSPTDETTSHSPKHQPLLYSLVLILKYEKKIHSSLDLREKEMLQKFSHPSFFVNKKVRVGLFNYTGTGISGISQLALALCNSTSIYHALEQSIEAAVQMYQVGAYLHPYLP